MFLVIRFNSVSVLVSKLNICSTSVVALSKDSLRCFPLKKVLFLF